MPVIDASWINGFTANCVYANAPHDPNGLPNCVSVSSATYAIGKTSVPRKGESLCANARSARYGVNAIKPKRIDASAYAMPCSGKMPFHQKKHAMVVASQP